LNVVIRMMLCRVSHAVRGLRWRVVRSVCLVIATYALLTLAGHWSMHGILPGDGFAFFHTAWAQEAPAPLCRFGVNFNVQKSGPPSDLTNYDIASLRAGWYIDYRALNEPPRPNGAEYVHMIRLSQERIESTETYTYTYSPRRSQLTTILGNNPASTVFVGNEPDRIQFQDGIDPDVYADAYHEIYHLIKKIDPTARVFAGSIVQPTELRLEYLDLVLQSYQQKYGALMPVDGWSIHNFILNERSCDHYGDISICWGADIPPGVDATDGLVITVEELEETRNPDLFIEQIERFRIWMAARGYTGQPVYLSEYGVLLPDIYQQFDFSPAAVNQFMNDTFDYVLNATDPELGDPTDGYRMVQRLSWYSVNDDFNYNGWLFNSDDFQRSVMGDNYAAYTAALSETVDFAVVALRTAPPFQLDGSDPITVTVRAQIANSGNTVAKQPAVVRFYQGDPAAGGVQIGADQTVELAGCGADTWVTVQWPNVAPDRYQLFATVTPTGAVADRDPSDNVRTRLFFTSTDSLFLPLIESQRFVMK